MAGQPEVCGTNTYPEMPNPACETRMQGIENLNRQILVKVESIDKLLRGGCDGSLGLCARIVNLEADDKALKGAGGSVLKIIAQWLAGPVLGGLAGFFAAHHGGK